MRRYLFFSTGGHLILMLGWITSNALFSKPRMSYYGVDLVSSLPRGGSVGGAGDVGTPAVEAPKPVPEEAPKAAPPSTRPTERPLPSEDVIRVKGKATKATKPVPATTKKKGLNLKAALAAIEGEGGGAKRAGVPGGGGGSGISAQAGQPFPYPWYLKVISDRLDQKWNPPSSFSPDTVCTVTFVIHRDGQVSAIRMSKESGDTTFDELARRAVLYSNPLAPLPSGYPEETLNVHMSFQGK